MKNYSENTKKLREEIENADALVIGIGAGMSAERQDSIIQVSVLKRLSAIFRENTG